LPLTLVTRPRGEGVVRWTLSYFGPHRARIAGLAALSIAEIGLRAVGPWPMRAIVDHLSGTPRIESMLMAFVVIGLALQVAHQLVLLVHTRVQSRLAQQIVLDLRTQLFTHFQYLSLAHHTKTPTADAVHRLDADAGCVENLLLRGIFPSVFSALTLIVMFTILARLDLTLALVSVSVVPFLYLNLQRHMKRMRPHAEHTKTLESAVMARVYESLGAIRLVKTFAREDYEVGRFQGAASEATRARLEMTWHESMFSFLVAAITLAGSGAVLAIGGMHVLDGRISLGTLLPV